MEEVAAEPSMIIGRRWREYIVEFLEVGGKEMFSDGDVGSLDDAYARALEYVADPDVHAVFIKSMEYCEFVTRTFGDIDWDGSTRRIDALWVNGEQVWDLDPWQCYA